MRHSSRGAAARPTRTVNSADPIDAFFQTPPDDSSVELARVTRTLRGRLFGVEIPPICIGRYEVVRRVGAGAHGEVFDCRDTKLQRRVAIKVAFRAAQPKGDGFREAQAAAAIRHPNVVEVFDVGFVRLPSGSPQQHRPYVAMSYVGGPSLPQWLTETHTVGSRLEVVRAIARGIEAAHAVGVVHGDIKPANVLIDVDGVVRVADFSNAGLDARTTTTRDAVIGTPGYIAPEAYQGQRTPETDQFSLAATAWHVLTAAAPFVGDGVHQLRMAAQQGALVESRVPLPPRVAAALRRAMAVDPAQRWPSVAALCGQLQVATSRRWWPVAGITAAVVVTAVAVVPAPDRPSVTCLDTEAAAVWNEARAEQLTDAAGRISQTVASELAPAMQIHLEAWVQRWAGQRERACAESSTAALTTRACLRDAVLRVDETLAVIIDNRTALLRGLEALSRATDTQACLAAPASAYVASDQAQLVRRLLARATALGDAAQVSDARKVVEQAKSIAADSQEANLLIDADMVALRIEGTSSGEHNDALEAIAWRGLNAERLDIASRAAIELTLALITAKRLDEAERWHARADDWSVWGGANEIAAQHIGVQLALARRDYEGAAALAANARLQAEQDDARPIVAVHLLLAEAVARLELDELAQSQALLDQAQDIVEADFGRFHPLYAHIISERAMVALRRNDHRTARTLFLESLEILHELETEPSINYGRDLQNVGMATMGLGDPLGAIVWFERAAAVFVDKGEASDFDRARTDTALTRAAERAGLPHKALDYGRRATDGLDAMGLGADDPLRHYLNGLLRQICEDPKLQPRPPRCEPILAEP